MKLSEATRIVLTERLKVLVEKGEKYACGWEAGYKTATEVLQKANEGFAVQNAELLEALERVASAYAHIETCNMPAWLDAVEEAIRKAKEK